MTSPPIDKYLQTTRLYSKDASGNYVPLRMDDETGTLVTIEFEHHEAHEGSMFACHYVQEVSDTNDRSIIAFKTPNTTKRIHLLWGASATAAAHFYIFEGPTIASAVGADLTIFNKERNSLTASVVLSTKDGVAGKATYFTEATMGQVTGGTEIAHEWIGAGSKGKAQAGASRGSIEWILKANTIYSFELKSADANDNSHTLILSWYEHTGG